MKAGRSRPQRPWWAWLKDVPTEGVICVSARGPREAVALAREQLGAKSEVVVAAVLAADIDAIIEIASATPGATKVFFAFEQDLISGDPKAAENARERVRALRFGEEAGS